MSNSFEMQTIRISVRMAVIGLIFVISTVAGGVMWAQSIYVRLGNVELTLKEMRDSMKVISDITALREISIRQDARIEKLESWRLQHAIAGDK